jgi:glycosyltransferase involved in cell wall biosynthesis
MSDEFLRILTFVEGAYPNPEHMRLPIVPEICMALTARGHSVNLMVGGLLNKNIGELFGVGEDASGQANWSLKGLYVKSFPAFSKWSFSPAMINQTASYARRADIVLLQSLYSFPVLLGYLLSQRYRKPYCLWPHGALAPFLWHKSVSRKRIYEKLVARHILNQAAAIVFSSEGEREEVQFLRLKAPSVIIPHGFDTRPYEHLPERGAFRADFLQGHTGPVVLFLSRLNIKKGLDVLVRSFAQLIKRVPDARLAIVGNSDPISFQQRIQTWLREYGVTKSAVLTGPLYGLAKLQAFADADIFVLPSYEENFGSVIFEAMASRIPVVISDTLNYASEVEGYEAGLVVRRDSQEFALASLKLLTDAALRQRMGRNGLQLARAYSWETCGEKIERRIQCILEGKSLPADLTLDK